MIQLNTDTIKVKENGQWSNLSSLTGPQGERGATGATGPQGPQGIPGVPGYPTIETGDAGKVLVVNDTEDAVEWAKTVQGIDVIRTIDYEAEGWTLSHIVLTEDEKARIKIGAAFYISTGYPGLYICSTFNSNENTYYFYSYNNGDGAQFRVQNYVFGYNATQGTLAYIYGSLTSTYDQYQNYPEKFRNISWAPNNVYSVPTVLNSNNSYYWGWLPLPQAGDGLVMDDTTGNLSMSVPIVKEENMIVTPYSFDSVNNHIENQGSSSPYFDYNNNSTAIDNLCNALQNGQTVTIDFDWQSDIQITGTFSSTVRYEDNRFIFNVDDYNNQYSSAIYLYEMWACPTTDWSPQGFVFSFNQGVTINSVTIKISVGTGTYTYTQKLPIEAIECDKTVAGTYTLQCTVDAQGNKTYAWV